MKTLVWYTSDKVSAEGAREREKETEKERERERKSERERERAKTSRGVRAVLVGAERYTQKKLRKPDYGWLT